MTDDEAPADPPRLIAPIVLTALDYVWDRVMTRIAGMSSAEYLWEPVAECWTVRPGTDGLGRADHSRVDPVPAPVTTIAWRTWHVASDCLAGYTVGGLGAWPLDVEDDVWYLEPEPAVAAMGQAWSAFRAGLADLAEDGMWRPLGEKWGVFARDPWAALGLHALDEIAHHGAEIALLRDLYLREGSRPG